ncbi:MAG TPA: hypothetical protein VI968_00205 [archaeon]|nr:hypothetical protein [archaeon]
MKRLLPYAFALTLATPASADFPMSLFGVKQVFEQENMKRALRERIESSYAEPDTRANACLSGCVYRKVVDDSIEHPNFLDFPVYKLEVQGQDDWMDAHSRHNREPYFFVGTESDIQRLERAIMPGDTVEFNPTLSEGMIVLEGAEYPLLIAPVSGLQDITTPFQSIGP